jgi:predicted acyl esterase
VRNGGRRGGVAGAIALLLAVVAVWSAVAAPAQAAPAPLYGYATMTDGVKIAVVVTYPAGYQPSSRWPALFMMDGYEGAAGPLDPADWGDRYVMIHASLRGTGCSGGRFDLFDRVSAQDGHDIIDKWIPAQGWSNGDVGIIGHSYPGLTGFAVAETNPDHLKAIAVSGLIDDLYRGVSYIGGIPDSGFPLLWTGVARPASEQSGNLPRYGNETGSGDPTCAQNVATRPPPSALDDPIANGAANREDGVWWAAHSLITYIAGITKPIHIDQQYQDEQTGPRGGAVLWQRIPAGVPKRIVLTNGVHATHRIAHADDLAWLDCWILHAGSGCPGSVADSTQRVQIHFETTGPGNDPSRDQVNPPYVSSDYPLPEAAWQRYYFRADGTLSTTAPTTGEPGRSYASTPEGRQAYASGAGVADATFDQAEPALDGAYSQGYGRADSSKGPDELSYSLSFNGPTALAGPLEADLWVSSTAPDTDLFVQLVDVDSQGNYQYLQRGMLRASFRAVDDARSDKIAAGSLAGQIYRPYHPFTNPSPLTPAQAYKLQIEIFPLGHVFRAGHKLLVKIYSPPLMDELYSYDSGQAPAVNTILEDAGHPSSLLVPLLPSLPPISSTPPACGAQTGVRCVQPAAP